jgi:hypothetical protein
VASTLNCSDNPCQDKYVEAAKMFLQMLDSRIQWTDHSQRMAVYYFDAGIPASICAVNIVKSGPHG